MGSGKKQEALSREQSLNAVVVASDAIVIREREDGGITLGIPFRPSRFIGWLTRRFNLPETTERPLQLDEIGSFVWRMFDGRTPVRVMIERLSDSYKLNRKDAEISLTAFIRSVVRKRLAVLAVPNPEYRKKGG